MEFKYIDVIIAVTLNYIHFCASDDFPSCDVSKLGQCQDNEACNQTTRVCDCVPNFKRISGHCVDPATDTTDTTGSHSGTIAVAVIFTLALTVGGLILVARKYNLIRYVRQRIPWKRNDNITYEDVMIGQDDPPINP